MKRTSYPTDKPRFGAKLNHNHPLAREASGIYLLNESGGPKAFDLSGNNSHMTLYGAAKWNTYSGNDAPSIFVQNTTPPDYLSAVSIHGGDVPTTMFVRCRTYDANIYYRGAVSIGEAPNAAYLGHSNNELGGGRWGANYGTGIVPNVGQWYALAQTYDGTSFRIYVDGVLRSGPNPDICFGTARFVIGVIGDGYAGYPWLGQIDFAYFFKRALSADEVKWLTATPYEMFEEPRVVRYFYGEAVAPGGGLSIPVAMHHLRQQGIA